MLAGMTPPTPAAPAAAPDAAALAMAGTPLVGSPASIQMRAIQLLEEIRAGSVDADSFAGNSVLALNAMGFDVPPMIRPMLANALRAGFAK